MMRPLQFFLTGTDTDVGKTTAAAAMCAAWGYAYWKVVQAGMLPETDRQTVVRRAGVQTYPEAYRLQRPASPHASARDEGVRIDPSTLRLPTEGPLLVEGAGGFCVPLAADPWVWQAEIPRRLGLPVVVVGRTGLGTLHHTTSTVAAVRAAGLSCVGLVLVGDAHPENEADLAALTGVQVWGRLPRVSSLDAEFGTLVQAARQFGGAR
jgi:dethiobiotin synthetase